MKKLFFISIIFLFNIVLLEGLLRVYLVVKYESPLIVYRKFGYDRHPLMGFEVMPNISDQYFPSVATKFSSNSVGLRGSREYGPKEKNEIRVGIMGGSSVFGFGATDDSKTLSQQLENELSRLNPDVKWTVINGGNPAYVSYQVMARLQLRMIELEPDVMLFYMGWNDMFMGFPHLMGRNRFLKDLIVYDMDSWQSFISNFNKANYPVAGLNELAISLFSKRVFMRLFPKKTVFDDVVKVLPNDEVEPSVKENKVENNGVAMNYCISGEDFPEVTGMLKDNLTSIAGICHAHGIKCNLSSLVSDVNLYGNDRESLNKAIKEVADKQKATFIDSDSYIKSLNAKGINNPVDKYHLTDKGNEVLAKYWAPIILKQVN